MAEAAFRTHEVFNQSPPFEDVNLFALDRPLAEAVTANGGLAAADELSEFGRHWGSAAMAARGRAANENPPKLRLFDARGNRRDEVEFHEATLLRLVVRDVGPLDQSLGRRGAAVDRQQQTDHRAPSRRLIVAGEPLDLVLQEREHFAGQHAREHCDVRIDLPGVRHESVNSNQRTQGRNSSSSSAVPAGTSTPR